MFPFTNQICENLTIEVLSEFRAKVRCLKLETMKVEVDPVAEVIGLLFLAGTDNREQDSKLLGRLCSTKRSSCSTCYILCNTEIRQESTCSLRVEIYCRHGKQR